GAAPMPRFVVISLLLAASLPCAGCITDVTKDPQHKLPGFEVGKVYVLKQPATIEKEASDLSAVKAGPTHRLTVPTKDNPDALDLIRAGTRLEYKKTFLWANLNSSVIPVADI